MTPPKFSTAAALDFVNQLAGKFDQAVKNSPIPDIEKNVRQGIVSQLAKNGLVTREEYDIQVAMLEKARTQLIALEAKLATLEEKLAAK